MNVIIITARTPGIAKTCATDMRFPTGNPGKSGAPNAIHAMSASANALRIPKTPRHPIAWLTKVPAGTPIDIATDTPTIAMAIARPRRFAGAILDA